MLIRQARATDAEDLRVLYHEFLTQYPPKEEQDMDLWEKVIEECATDESLFLLVVEEDGKVVSSVQLAIIPSLTHNVKPFGVIENVVTHGDYQKRGYASALLDRASEIAKEFDCYKVFLETGSQKESTLNFYSSCGFAMDQKHSFQKRFS